MRPLSRINWWPKSIPSSKRHNRLPELRSTRSLNKRKMNVLFIRKRSGSLKVFTSKTTKSDKINFSFWLNKNTTRMKSPKNKRNLTNSNTTTKTSSFEFNKLRTKSHEMPQNTKKKKWLLIKSIIASKSKLIFISTEPKWDKIKSSSWMTSEKSQKY